MPYLDLNIQPEPSSLDAFLPFLKKAGYSAAALCFFFNGKEKIKKPEIKEISKEDSIQLYTVASVEIITKEEMNMLQHRSNIDKYDLICIIPQTITAFKEACLSTEIDLIRLEPKKTFNYKNIRSHLIKTAAIKGIFFEIQYTFLMHSFQRRFLIKIVDKIIRAGCAKSILFTSGAKNIKHIKYAQNVSYLAELAGIKDPENVMSRNALDVLKKAKDRKRRKKRIICFRSNKTEKKTLN